MILREAGPEDENGIANILKESYNIDTLEEGAKVFMEEVQKGHHYIVAEETGKIVGLVTWTMHDLPKHELAELNRIAVLPAFRGKGVARQLFDRIIASLEEFYKSHGRKLRKLYLLTHASNNGAQEFYKKIGFKHETTIKEHYYKGEDEYVFSMFFE